MKAHSIRTGGGDRISIQVDDQSTTPVGNEVATAASNAATLNAGFGNITSEALTTTAGSTYTLTLTNNKILASSLVMVSVNLGAGTGGTPTVASVKPAAGSVVIIIQNIHASAAFNAAIKIQFVVFN
jgi:hypothetical protein